MPDPIVLDPAPYTLKANINSDQITALVALIASANLVQLPATADWQNATDLSVSIAPNGEGRFEVSFSR